MPVADMTAELEKEAEKIRSRLAPKREEIRADEEQLARLEAAIDVLKGNVALASRPARSSSPSSSRSRGSIDEEAIIGFVRSNQPVSARDIGQQIGVTGNRLSVKLGRMVNAGVLTKTGERRGTKYSAA
jgi:hypothetical protein